MKAQTGREYDMHLNIMGVRDGKEVPIPKDLDAFVIETSKGAIYIDLGGSVPDMVLMRATYASDDQKREGEVRLVLSPMTGRMAVGVIRT